jgi:NADPH:quinone reductase-like Zn-dependent oxidoreductase
MRAVVLDRFGPPEVLGLRDVDEPPVGDGDVLVRVRAASVNPADWYAMTGTPWVARPTMGLRKPRATRVGLDLAGVVAAVGGDVTRFKPGDEVFGAGTGTLAEQVAVAEDTLVPKPSNLSFEQAAAVPVAGLTALQGLRDKGRLRPGQQVLVNGASGGVGTFAVQIAKALGAEVTGVCIGAPKGSRLLGPLGHIAKVRLASLRAGQRVVFFISKATTEDLTALADLLEAGTVTPVVERTYALSEAVHAFRHLGEGHARGKLVVVV